MFYIFRLMRFLQKAMKLMTKLTPRKGPNDNSLSNVYRFLVLTSNFVVEARHNILKEGSLRPPTPPLCLTLYNIFTHHNVNFKMWYIISKVEIVFPHHSPFYKPKPKLLLQCSNSFFQPYIYE